MVVQRRDRRAGAEGRQGSICPGERRAAARRGWVAAGDLAVGDAIRALSGDAGVVTGLKLKKLDSPIPVYNLNVEGFHSYFVAGGVLVHNGCGKSTPGNNKVQNKQARDIAKRLQLNDPAKKRELHDLISGQGYSFQEALETAKFFFGQNSYLT